MTARPAVQKVPIGNLRYNADAAGLRSGLLVTGADPVDRSSQATLRLLQATGAIQERIARSLASALRYQNGELAVKLHWRAVLADGATLRSIGLGRDNNLGRWLRRVRGERWWIVAKIAGIGSSFSGLSFAGLSSCGMGPPQPSA